jgi:hypothetical protein
MEGNFSNQITEVYAHVHSLHAVSYSSAFFQTITHDSKKRQKVHFNKTKSDGASKDSITYREVSSLCDGGIQFCDNSFSCSEMEPWSKDEPNSILASFNKLLFSRTKKSKGCPDTTGE